MSRRKFVGVVVIGGAFGTAAMALPLPAQNIVKPDRKKSDTARLSDVVREQNVWVSMRDGARLSTDLYLPAEEGEALAGQWPAVMIRTAYNKSGFANRASFFASHGYLSIVQDVRGTFASEGEFVPFINEADDGCDTLSWLVNHELCNGKVGTYGCSYMGWTQLAMATQNPPGLCCMIPFGTAIDTFHHYAYPDGGRQLGLIRWVIYDVWARAARNKPQEKAAIESIDFFRLAAQLPWRRGETPLAQSPHFENVIFNYLENDTYNDFWKQPGHAFDIYFDQFPDIPILWVSGWYDGYPRSSCEGYEKLSVLGRKHNQHLLLGPWIHNQMSGNTCGGADFGPDADISRMGVQLAFFDRWLKGNENVEIPRVRAFMMGGGSGRRTEEGRLHHGGRWWQGSDWPPPEAEMTPWYLGPGRTLSPEKPMQAEASTSYRYDPSDPVPSIACPWQFPGHAPRGPADQVEPTELLGNCQPGRPLKDRPDVLVFQSEPLDRPLTVIGPVRVRLFVSSTTPDTDFAAKIIDVYPPNSDYPRGYSFPVCEGLLRMRYRNSDTETELMEPCRIYEIEIECFPTANFFAAGHRIRLDITSSNFPRYDVNPNTGDPKSSDRKVARNTIHHDFARPSHVILPVIDANNTRVIPFPS